MERFRAAWVLPIASPPIRNGWVEVHEGRITGVGSAGPPSGVAIDIDLGQVAVLPGLVNAHTHLELSYLRGAIPPARDFVGWIRDVIAARAAAPDPAVVVDAASRAIGEAVQCGTALVGDISNTLVTCEPLDASPLAAVVFYELLGFNLPDPGQTVTTALARLGSLALSRRIRIGLAAHAPYSVSPGLFRALRAGRDGGDRAAPHSVHLAESAAEVEFLAAGGGPWRRLLEDLGVWHAGWSAPGRTPVDYLDGLGALDARALAVHLVHATPRDLRTLADRGATVVTCPRSNALTGAGRPPVETFYASGARVAVGTDSLVTVPDLNLFAELAELRRLAPEVPAARLLASATREGARALGFGAELGTLEAGRRAALVAVQVPPGLADVEEYLVSGIPPELLSWAGAASPHASGHGR
jgi:cytosine/adenosine deaminase-related metal-dependent hydrolase